MTPSGMRSKQKKESPPEERQAGVRIATQQQAFFWGLVALVVKCSKSREFSHELSVLELGHH